MLIEILQLLWYSFLNGLLYLFDFFTTPAMLLWFLSIVFFALIFVEENKEIEEQFVDDMRDLL